jgi:hypothetical protein
LAGFAFNLSESAMAVMKAWLSVMMVFGLYGTVAQLAFQFVRFKAGEFVFVEIIGMRDRTWSFLCQGLKCPALKVLRAGAKAVWSAGPAKVTTVPQASSGVRRNIYADY